MVNLQEEAILVVHPYYPQLKGEVKEKGYFDNYIANLEALLEARDLTNGAVLFDASEHHRQRSHRLGIKHFIETEKTTGMPINPKDLEILRDVKKLIIVGSKVGQCLLTAECSVRDRFPDIELVYELDACYDDLHKYRDITKGDRF
jgi:hypothetical protein